MTVSELTIVHYPHPALRWKSKPLKRIDAELRAMVERMFELMHEADGIGLAANQVALPYQLFVVELRNEDGSRGERQVFVNPVIVERKGSEEGEEGCLSLPKLYGQVRRAGNIKIEAFDLDGNELQIAAEELAARVVQHESDHLEGTLFVDRMTELSRREVGPHLADFTRVYRRRQELGEIPPDAVLEQRLRELEALRT